MDYTVIRKNIRNLYLRVKPDGRVVVSAPRFASARTIEAFVASRAGWIDRQRKRLAARPDVASSDIRDGAELYLWGKPKTLRIVEGSRWALEVQGDEARFTVRPNASAELRERHWRECLRKRFADEVARRHPIWEARTGLHADEWRTKFMKTRWGTCAIAARRIWLNVALVHYPTECLDYVIVHELVHLRERTHGLAFQALMDRFYPDWRRVRRELAG